MVEDIVYSHMEIWGRKPNKSNDFVKNISRAAAISAGDLALAMSRANASARLAGKICAWTYGNIWIEKSEITQIGEP